MPKNPYPGKKIFSLDNFFESSVTFSEISLNPEINLNLQKPSEQGSLNNDTIEQMIEEYIKNPTYLRFKNKITVGDLNGTNYIIDGQHRINMAKKLYEDYQINDNLIFLWYKCKTEDDIRSIFNSLNIDSTKNNFYIQQDKFDQLNINEFLKLLKTSYSSLFAKRKTENGKLKTIEEFRDDLIKINFFKNVNCYEKKIFSKYKSIQYLIRKNDEFYKKASYEINFRHNESIFYKDELKNIKDKIIFSLKGNNFIEWLNNNNELPYHKYKTQKEPISQYIKKQIWKKEFGDSNTEKCPISFCNTILLNGQKNGWHAGHIISEYNGGKTIIENLRPICKNCNSSMGSKNWNDYDII